MKNWKRWKRRTIGLWAAVLLLIGTEAPAAGGEYLARAVGPEPVKKKEFAGPILLGAAMDPDLPSGDTEPVLLSADTEADLPSGDTGTDIASGDTGTDLPSGDTGTDLPSADIEPVLLSADTGMDLPSAATEPATPAERLAAVVTEGLESVEQPKLVTENTSSADGAPSDPLKTLGDNPEKRLLLFDDADWGRRQVYETEEEAAAHMADIDVPVWTLWKGVKSKGTMHLTVHKALMEDVSQIFNEIFNDPEQFPIESMGGFRYRTGTYGEHNNGTAIDLNADQNFQVRDGEALTGTCWEPGVNPYSFPEDGSVVRIFKEHGWSWGGDAWEDTADASTGYHDYMHFSYRGM